MLRVLFVTSEAWPLITTGGLGEVSGSLPRALKQLGCDIRLVLPAYREVLRRADTPKEGLNKSLFTPLPLGEGGGEGGNLMRERELYRRFLKTAAELNLPAYGQKVRLLQGSLQNGLTVYLVDAPELFDRPGGPYCTPEGQDWPDNAERFALFAHAAVELAQDRAGLSWQPDVIHCNDWQTGLVPALLAREQARPATVFTIHNLAYQGLFDRRTFTSLQLPHDFWDPEAMEFYGRFSFIKGGVAFAELLTTVSPTYAREIQTPELGFGLEGLLRHRSPVLVGILNGVDYSIWDPRHDPHIAERYDPEGIERKAINKRDLQHCFNLREDANALLLGSVSRLVEQKGVDLILEAMPALCAENLQLVVLGSGDAHLEAGVKRLALEYPGQVGATIGYNEALAHRIVAGADAFLMPSRFEPCGLNQMYSLRYGTVPVVRSTGGLTDTVVDTTLETLQMGAATGFTFKEPTPDALLSAIRRALHGYRDRNTWSQLQITGMAQYFGWERSAQAYVDAYRRTRDRVA